MDNLITQDPFEPLYEPGTVKYRPYPKHVVEGVDYLVRISRGRTDVKTANDWALVAKIFEFWTRIFPHEWQEFASSIKDIKATRLRKDGKSRLGEIKYVAALPYRFERLIKTCFPKQQFDKEFVYKLVKNVKIVQVGERNDAWFTIPNAPERRKSVEEMISKVVK